MLQMMLRPRWVLALLAALGIAAGFALLGQWQLDRAVEQAVVQERPTEEVRPLADVAEPDGPTEQAATGQRVEVSGTFVPGDTVIVEGRLNDGVAGYWPVAHLEVTDATPGGLPVALGWAADLETARDGRRTVRRRRRATRSRSSDDSCRARRPMVPAEDADPFSMTTVAVAQLINVWADYDDRPVYFAYVTATDPVAGLEADRVAAARGDRGAQLAQRVLRRSSGSCSPGSRSSSGIGSCAMRWSASATRPRGGGRGCGSDDGPGHAVGRCADSGGRLTVPPAANSAIAASRRGR